MNIDLFQYTGTVKVSLGKTVRTYHNAGTPQLFRLFATCLEDPTKITTLNTPQQVMLKGKNENNLLVDALYYSIKGLYKQVITTNTGYGLKITLTILPSNISNIDLKEFQLSLLDGENMELAVIDIDDNLVKQISTGRQALVEWILAVNNYSEEE